MSHASHWRHKVDKHLTEATYPLICVVGATACGKTGFSIDVCRHIGVDAQVINADSRQLYKRLDIGTAKITESEMQGVEHHLIDTLDPKEDSTAGQYQIDARNTIDALQAQGKVPVLVGGSMLYVSSIIDALTMAPMTDAALRERLLREYDELGGSRLHERLERLDPVTAAKTHPNNKPRIIRALEIHELCAAPKTEAVPSSELRSGQDSSGYDTLIFGIHRERSDIVDRINRRARHMFERGWLAEVEGLISDGYVRDDPGMKSHGYREIMTWMDRGRPMSEAELCESIAVKTRRYAKRQLTWWRGDPRIQWLDATAI